MSVRTVLKRCWQAAPQSLRRLVLGALCLFLAQRRDPKAGGVAGQDAAGANSTGGPLFLCGEFAFSSGLGESARLYASSWGACAQDGADLSPQASRNALWQVDITRAVGHNPDRPLPPGVLTLSELRERWRAGSLPSGGRVVIHANPPHFQLVLCRLGKAFLRDRQVVGYWAWELETLPAIWLQALNYVDALEVPSRFTQAAIEAHTAKPVSLRSHNPQGPREEGRRRIFSRDGVLRCLFVFDGGVSLERKNPEAALRAFEQAFAPGEGELTLKAGGDLDNAAFERFRQRCAGAPGVRLLTDPLNREELEALYLSHDVYLSLHRSEGYGLTLHEAMLCGLHVVATGWSGNMDFMTGPLAHPVPYTLVPVRLTSGPCKGLQARWAEADVSAAADLLRRLRRELVCPHE